MSAELKWRKVPGGFRMGGAVGEPHAFIQRATLDNGEVVWVWFAYCDTGDGQKSSAEGWSYTLGDNGDDGAKHRAGSWLKNRLAGKTP